MIRSSPAGAPSRWKFIRLCPVVLMAFGAGASVAMAQATPPASGAPAAPAAGTTSFKPIEDRIKNAEPLPPADQQALSASIKDKVALLGSATPSEQTRARTWLVSEASLPGDKPAKNGYVTAYGNAVSANVAPLITSPDARTRLNAAIVVAETARVTGGTQLAPTALQLLNDKSEAVVLWGMKAVRWIGQAQLRAALPPTVANAVVPTVKNHSTGQVAGAIATEAYEALTLDVLGPNFAKVTPAQAGAMSPLVLQLLQARIPLYTKGVPPAPRADATGTRFLSDPKVWPTLGAQQTAAMQAMSDVVALAAQQAQQANPADRAELAQTVYLAGLAVATQLPQASQAIQQAAQQINNPATATVAQIAGVAQAVATGLQSSTFKLNPPPAIVANQPAPAPVTATTGPVLIPGESATPTLPPAAATPVPPGTTPATGPAGAAGAAPKAGGATAPKPPANGGGAGAPHTNAPGAGGSAAGAGAHGATRPATPK